MGCAEANIPFVISHPVMLFKSACPLYSSSGGITKRGDRYLRKQLVHGARAVLFRSKGKKDQLNRWAHSVAERRGVPKTSIALAARLARLAWTLMQRIQWINLGFKSFVILPW